MMEVVIGLDKEGPTEWEECLPNQQEVDLWISMCINLESDLSTLCVSHLISATASFDLQEHGHHTDA